MAEKELIQLFGEQKVRTKWDDEKEKWYFSIVDVCWVLTDQPDYDGAKNYWKVLKFRLKAEGNESVTNCNQLKMVSPKDGKRYKTAVARKGGKIAGDARKKLESQIGRSVITREKASDYLPPAERIQELPEETED